jgi:hypothetical protein
MVITCKAYKTRLSEGNVYTAKCTVFGSFKSNIVGLIIEIALTSSFLCWMVTTKFKELSYLLPITIQCAVMSHSSIDIRLFGFSIDMLF